MTKEALVGWSESRIGFKFFPFIFKEVYLRIPTGCFSRTYEFIRSLSVQLLTFLRISAISTRFEQVVVFLVVRSVLEVRNPLELSEISRHLLLSYESRLLLEPARFV
jgi:hypothetical protein